MKSQKKISRRDAIKLLGAVAGATALANLPSKWSKPELVSGVLPAHAQTSAVCWAVYIEVLSGNFIYTVQNGPAPDLTTGSGGSGSVLAWACQTGCLFLWLDLITATSASGSVRITTLTGSTTVNYTNSDFTRDIVIEMGTGALSVLPGGAGGSAGSCVFPLTLNSLVSPQGITTERTQRANSWK